MSTCCGARRLSSAPWRRRRRGSTPRPARSKIRTTCRRSVRLARNCRAKSPISPRFENTALAAKLVPSMMGADGPRTYFIGFQTNAEAREQADYSADSESYDSTRANRRSIRWRRTTISPTPSLPSILDSSTTRCTATPTPSPTSVIAISAHTFRTPRKFGSLCGQSKRGPLLTV